MIRVGVISDLDENRKKKINKKNESGLSHVLAESYNSR